MTTNNPPAISGEIIRILRILKGIKQTEAAGKLGITQQAYSKIELNVVISSAKVAEILQAFNCNWKDLENIMQLTPRQ